MGGHINLATKNVFGVADAKRRIDEGWVQIRGEYLDRIVVATSDMHWEGDTAHFKVRALGAEAKAELVVTPDDLTIDIVLPWVLASLGPVIEAIIKERTVAALNEKQPNGAPPPSGPA